MATRANAAAGGLLGIVVAVVLGLAIVGAPLYIAFLRSDAQALDAKVQDDVETIRRVVLNVDENLSAVKDLRDLARADSEGSTAEELVKDPQAAFASIMTDLDASTRRIETLINEDQQARGLKVSEQAPARGRPDVTRALADLRGKYLNENKKLLDSARECAGRIKGATAGDERATSHLGTQRILALLAFTEGRVLANRAEFERLLAADLRSEAVSRLTEVSDLRRATERAESEQPVTLLAQLNENIAKADGTLKKLDDAINGLSGMIAQREADLAAATGRADAARRQLVQLETRGTHAGGRDASNAFEQYRQEYERLSDEARAAEAQASAIENGTLKDAVLPPEQSDDLLAGKYEGGTRQEGIRDLKSRLEELEAAKKSYDQSRSDLVKKKEALEQRSEQLASAKSKAEGDAGSRSEQVEAVLADARKHDEQADAAAQAAMKQFSEGEGYVKAALSAASTKKRAAQTAKLDSAGGTVEHPFESLTRDNETEASLHILAAEIAYQSALCELERLRSIQAAYNTSALAAKMGGGAEPEDSSARIEEIRTAALDKAAQAVKSYEQAANLIKSSSFKSASGPPISGTQYVWQVQVAQAAVHMLASQLRADKAEADADRNLAYTLLTSAAQGREQSPLLTPALSTLVYLQKTVE